MTRKKAQDTGPSTFFEWVIGTTVENATRYHNKPKKQPRRERVRIELSTDDESETDSLKVTYPRSGRRGDPAVALVKPKSKSKEAEGSKKVRFEEDGKLLKSALKKTTTTTVEEIQTDEETDDESDNEKPAKKCKTKAKKDESTSEEESAASDDESTCNCPDCVRARQKAKKKQPQEQQQQCMKKQKGQKKKAAAEESEDSESDTPSKKNKDGKKKGNKAESESEGESSAEDTDSESEKNNISKKQKQKGGKKGKDQTPGESSAEEEKPTKKNKNQQKKNNEADPNSSKKRDKEENANKKGNYPEGLPGPHPRRPNYIEPVRAEVVQTERVMEGPEDPKPNAYYDSEHNVVRVYYGPVYGGNHGQGLYPKRDPSGRPLPMGTPHPTQNPYFNGFKDGNAEGQGAAHVPVTQGMPMNSMYAPAPWGYPPPPHMMYPGGPPPPIPEGGWNKGAFAQVNGAGGPAEKNSATNNAGPGSIKAPSLEGKNNPYYQRATANLPRSKFSGWGSQGSRKASERSEAAPWGPTGSNNGGNNSWGHNSNRGSWGGGNINASNGNWNGEPAQLSGQQDSFPKDTSWETPNNGKQTDGANDWGTTNNNNAAADSWGNVNQTSNTDSWGANAGPNDWNAPQPSPPKATAAPEEDNVGPMPKMPGSWDSTPAWGDPTAAAATGGAVDNEVDDGMPYGGW